MIFISWTFILLYIAGIVHISGLVFYGILFLVYLAISLAIRIAASVSVTGRTLPTSTRSAGWQLKISKHLVIEICEPPYRIRVR